MIKHLAGKTIFITGASRGIGKAIAKRCAKDGANIVIAAKTAEPHPKLPGTIYSAAKEIEDEGGNCLPCIVDIRNEDQVKQSVEEAVKKYGGIDILINNASAISLTGTLDTTMKKYDLMNQVNARGTYLSSRAVLPYLLKSKNPHILNLSPPLNMNPKWFKNHVAYTMAKYGMSFCVLGMSEEFKEAGVAVNALWPRTAIATDAIDLITGSPDFRKSCRNEQIMADAAYQILIKDSRTFTGNFVIDEEILRKELNMTNFDKYAIQPGNSLLLDFFLEDDDGGSTTKIKLQDKTVAEESSPSKSENDVTESIALMKPLLSQELVKKTNGIFQFKISDGKPQEWYLDLKTGNGSISFEKPKDLKPDCTMTMKAQVFKKMVEGSLKPTGAFMSGQLKISGDMSLAMKLEKIMSSFKKAAKL